MERLTFYRSGRFVTSWVITICLLAGVFVASASAKEVVLKGYYIWGKRWESNDAYFKWADMVNEFGKGLVRIQFVGGPETIPSLDALDYLRRGAIDVMNTAMGYHSGIVPEGEATSMWYGPPWIEREAGFIDLLDRIYRKKVGLTLLGRAQTGGAVCLFSRKPVEKLDLSGLKFRSLKAYDPVVKMLGGTVQMISAEEVYSALERGVVDGMGWSGQLGFKQAKLDEVLHYRIGPYFGQTDTGILMRASQFDELPAEVKDLLHKTLVLAEAYNYYATRDLYLTRWKEMVRDSDTLKVPQFSPEQEKKFLADAWNAKMEELVVKPSAEYGQAMKDILESIKDKQVEPPVR